MASNPITLTIPANTKGTINAFSNAAWYQQLTLSWPGGSAVLGGSGEGRQMTTPSGQASIGFDPSDQPVQVTATFSFSQNGSGGPFSPARVQDPMVTVNGPFVITQVTSEDGNDNDNNDTYMTLVTVSMQADAVTSAETLAAAGSGKPAAQIEDVELELHAKTYYNNPFVQGGDEHYFGVPSNGSTFGSISYRGQSWSGRNGSYYDQQTPFGGYLNVYIQLYDCLHPGMHDRVLDLTTQISYWGSRPTGWRSANWDWEATGSGDYTVTRVTD